MFEEDPAAVIGGYIIFLIILIIGAILFFISGYIYFLPSIIASSKRHPQFVPILLINLFFGETVIGWVGTMVWAATHRIGRHTHW
ncbi:superinfection immunity protein [bacterium]|nr:superinfection immunity protein [bacterium]